MEGTLSLEQRQAVADHEAFVKNTSLMKQIVSEMREISELPSEIPTDVNPLEKVEFPPQGGVLTYMGNFAHPYKGFPFFEFVDKIDSMKKTLRAVMSSFYHSIKRQPWRLLGLFFILSPLTRAFVYTFHRMIDRFKLKPIRYSDAMRELYRAFSVEYEETKSIREFRFMLRDIICMVLEFDNAYRFRFQDVIVELDRSKNPRKEISRLLRLLSDRERTQEIKDTWTLVRYFLSFYMSMNRSFRKSVTRILNELDLEKVALSVEDKCYCEKRKDYKFKFLE